MATEFEKKAFQTSLGIEATIQRDKYGGDAPERANKALRMIGESSNPNPAYQYLGSAAFHVYLAPHTGNALFLSQVQTLQGTEELTAQAACQNFMGDVIEFYTGKRPGKLRSGF